MKLRLILASVAWLILILVICAIPGNSLPSSTLFNIPHFDKIVHAVLYIPISFLLLAFFRLSTSSLLRKTAALLSLFIVFAYGGIIELLQSNLFRDRSGDWKDLAADMAGGIIGLMIYLLFARWLKPGQKADLKG